MTLANKVQQFNEDADLVHAIVHGPAIGAGSTVETEGGPVRTFAKISEDGGTLNLDLAASSGSSLVGFLQSVTGAVARTMQDKARELLSFKDRGADSTGAADASAAIAAVFAEGQATNRQVRVAGEKYKLGAAVLLPYHVAADFGQATIDGSAVPAGQYAITAKNLSALTNFQRPSMWKGLDLDLGASGAYGVKIEAPTGQWSVSDFAAETWRIKGGARGLGFGQNTWLVNFRNIEVTGQTDIGIDATTGLNAGEGMTFYGGVVANCKNPGGTAIAFRTDYNPADAGGGMWKCFGMSFDYSNILIHHKHGSMELHGCHIENDGALPMVKIEQVAGRSVVSFHAFGGAWYNNPASTRTKVIEVTGSAVVDIQGGECIAIANTENLEFVSVVPGSTPTVSIRGVSFNLWPGLSANIGRICGYTSLVRNGDFEDATALAGWGMDAVNFLRNGGFSGGVDGVIGSGGQWATGMGLVGSLNGLNQPTLTYTNVNGRPVMKVRFTGVPTASASTGIYFYNGTDVATKQGDLWKLRTYARLVGAATGITQFNLQLTERAAGGGAVTSGSTLIVPAAERKLFTFGSYAVQDATAAYLHSALNFSYTNGVAVDFTLEIDIPSLMLAPMEYADIIRSDTATALPTYRAALPAAGGRTAAKCLKLYSTAVESVGVYSKVPVKSREWLVGRGYANITALTAGSAGLKVSWRDAADAEISSQNIRPAYLAATGAYAQQSGVRVAPVGTERARLHCWLEAFNGTVLFDDVEAWVI